MMKKNQKERRKFIRAKRAVCVQYRLFKRGTQVFKGAPWNYSSTQDMSLGGILLISNEPYQLRDILELRIILSGILEMFSGFGKIVRVEKKKRGYVYHVAISFIPAMKQQSKEISQKITKKRSAKSYIKTPIKGKKKRK